MLSAPKNTRRWCLRVAPALLLGSVALILASLLVANDLPLDAELFRIGMALLTLAATGWVVARAHATELQIECIRQQAYDSGYSDGSDVARVVQMRRPSAPVVPVLAVAGDGPAQQLGDQRDVGH